MLVGLVPGLSRAITSSRLLAFDELSGEEQQQLLSILKSHPRYAEDFTPPEKIRSVDRFRVGTAGYWPDIARK